MLHFEVHVNGKKKKTIKANNANSVYTQYNKYCKERGCTYYMPNKESFGEISWVHPEQGKFVLVRIK